MNQNTPKRPVRVGLISLGCAKNLVDAEIMLGSLMKGGVEITNDAAQADVVIVNTCSFIDSAQEESVDTILESAEVRQANNRGQGLIVSGCLPQRFRDELPKLLPEVDAFMGIDQVANVTEIVHKAMVHRAERLAAPLQRKPSRSKVKEKIVNRFAELDKNGAPSHDHEEKLRGTDKFGNSGVLVAPKVSPGGPASVDVNIRPNFIPDFETPRFRLTPRHFSYVKIAEGCNHPCSFCIIPRMRGSHRSRAQSDIVKEVRQLVADGVKEINLISQDTTYYGLDLRPERSGSISSPEKFKAAAKSLPVSATTLCTLLRELNQIEGDFWIRLLYTHPAHWTDELIQTIADSPKVARYVDMPLQHIHENMLERMRRETSQKYIEDLIARIRAGIPGIALRTTFIVGFPGETEACFDTLLEFIQKTKFERLGVFTYSQEEGTRAGKMEGQLPDKVRKKRRDAAMRAQHEVSVQVSQSFVGRTMRVLVEGEASARDLGKANVHSWEHGLIRENGGQLLPSKGKYLVARGEADAPDIDGRVYILGKQVPLGDFANVRIIGHTDYDLIAQPA
ncbi:MAG TPA: 30S ribosomal protein S12 methylthiotransferase RimO [Candidatus Saccharimonadales bacterium]|nr:30S ribosomal protein S12 methylthiotransferase RimO [Candidatus Saccharimonadales bacterium]